jgi:hypothetical protein|tara:strand:- start:151 stop:348 length:198 start_codon:yes stop_codon:yes gene_type:complete
MGKLLLTTSTEGSVIIADVPKKHNKGKKEYFVSESFLEVNQKNFVDISDSTDWDGRIFMLKSDIN